MTVPVKLPPKIPASAPSRPDNTRSGGVARLCVGSSATISVLDPDSSNPNFVVHPVPVLLRYAAFEREDGHVFIIEKAMNCNFQVAG
jgi:hypothetical protein